MTRIKINDISEDRKISTEELRAIMGGGIPSGMFAAGLTSMYDPQIKAYDYYGPWGAQFIPSQSDPSKLLR